MALPNTLPFVLGTLAPASLAGAGVLSAAVKVKVAATLTGQGTLTPGHERTAALSGAGVLSAATKPVIKINVALTGHAALAGLEQVSLPYTLPFVLGTVRSGAFAGVGVLSVTTKQVFKVAAALTGYGVSKDGNHRAAPLSGAGTLSAATKPVIKTGAPLIGHGALAGLGKIADTAHLSGAGVLSTPLKVKVTAALTGHGTFFKVIPATSGTVNSTGTLSATAKAKIPVTAYLTGTGHPTGNGYAKTGSTAPFTGSGQLTSNAYSISVYDVVGTGYTSCDTYEATWTHNATAGSYIIAQIFAQPAPETVYYGETQMTNLGGVTVSSGFGYLTFYGLANVIGGETTITADWGDANARIVVANSTSYTNAENVINPQGISNQYGAISAQSINAEQGLIVQAFAGIFTWGSAAYLTDYAAGTARWINQVDQYTTGPISATCIVGDSSETTTFATDLAKIGPERYEHLDYVWASFAVVLSSNGLDELRASPPRSVPTGAAAAPTAGTGVLSATAFPIVRMQAPAPPTRQTPTTRKISIAPIARQGRRTFAVSR